MKTNYDQKMQAVLSGLSRDNKPHLLLQCCCAPCSSGVLDRLVDSFEVTLYYFNPNTWPEEEYHRRGKEFEKLLAGFGYEDKVQMLYCPWEGERFDAIAAGYEEEPEGGARCPRCFRLRLEETARAAREGGYDWFCTTLSVSPHKNAQLLNEIGQEMAEKYGVPFLPSDFKKREGFKNSIQRSKDFDLYRQDYCGCEYSYKQAKEH